MQPEYKILVVDDHPAVGYGMRRILKTQEDMEICGEAADGAAALKLVSEHRPDLVLLDVALGFHQSGLELIKRMQALHPKVLILMISVHEPERYAEDALRRGAHGFIPKDAEPAVFIAAVRTVLSGKTYLPDEVRERVLARIGASSEPTGVADLTERERQVFQKIGQGEGSRAIAESLDLSMKTVDVYRQRIKLKLGLVNSSELTRRAVEWVLHRSADPQPTRLSPESPAPAMDSSELLKPIQTGHGFDAIAKSCPSASAGAFDFFPEVAQRQK